MSVPKYLRTEWRSIRHAYLLASTDDNIQFKNVSSNDSNCFNNGMELFISTLNIWEYENSYNLFEYCEDNERGEKCKEIKPSVLSIQEDYNEQHNTENSIFKDLMKPTGVSQNIWGKWEAYRDEYIEIYIRLSWTHKFSDLCTQQYIEWHNSFLESCPSVISYISDGLDLPVVDKNGTKVDLQFDTGQHEQYIIDNYYKHFCSLRHWIHFHRFISFEKPEEFWAIQDFFKSVGVTELQIPICEVEDDCDVNNEFTTKGDASKQHETSNKDILNMNNVESLNNLDFENAHLDICGSDTNLNTSKSCNYFGQLGNFDKTINETYNGDTKDAKIINDEIKVIRNCEISKNNKVVFKTYQGCDKSNGKMSKAKKKLRNKKCIGVGWTLNHLKSQILQDRTDKDLYQCDNPIQNGCFTNVKFNDDLQLDEEHLTLSLDDTISLSDQGVLDAQENSVLNDAAVHDITGLHVNFLNDTNTRQCNTNINLCNTKQCETYKENCDINTSQYATNTDQHYTNPSQYDINTDLYDTNPSQYDTNPSQYDTNPSQYDTNTDIYDTNADQCGKNTIKNDTNIDYDNTTTDHYANTLVTAVQNGTSLVRHLFPRWIVSVMNFCLRGATFVMSSPFSSLLMRGLVVIEPMVSLVNFIYKWLLRSKVQSINKSKAIRQSISQRLLFFMQPVAKSINTTSIPNWVSHIQKSKDHRTAQEDLIEIHHVSDENQQTTLALSWLTDQQLGVPSSDLHEEFNRLLEGYRLVQFTKDNFQEDSALPSSLPPELHKYWMQRYRLFLRFDEGIQLDSESWFSVTPEMVSRHQAERCRCDVVVDAFCGAGGNAIHLASTCNHVMAIDNDPEKLSLARHNAQVYGVQDRIEFILGDFFELAPSLQADVVFLSPPWGGVEYLQEKVFNVLQMGGFGGTDGGLKVMESARKISRNIALFVPRNVDVLQLIELAGIEGKVDIEMSYISNKKKAITAYFEDLVLYNYDI